MCDRPPTLEAMQNHGQSDSMKAAMQAFERLMVEPPKMSATTPIATIGLDI